MTRDVQTRAHTRPRAQTFCTATDRHGRNFNM